MATYLWSDFPLGGSISGLYPDTDVISFDNPSISAGLGPSPDAQFDFFVDAGPTGYFSFGGVSVDVDLDPRQFTTANLTFASGSLFIFGDNTTATAADDGANTINGGSQGDWLVGGGGADLVSGGAGNDMLVVIGAGSLGDGAYGNDTLDGGSGIDQVFYDGAGLAVNVNLATGVATGGRGGDSTLKLSNIEQVVTGDGNDSVNGSAAANLLDGQDGNDRLDGKAGNDSLVGGDGADSLIGGDGNDTFDGGDGNDTIWGNAGDDSIDGGEGDDSMLGGAGNDTYRVIETGDKVVELAGEGTDTIITNRSIDMAANVENLVWINSGAGGTCNGNDLDNVMSASVGGGALTMNGAGGSDTVSYAGTEFGIEVDLEAGFGSFIATLVSMENATGGNQGDTLSGNDLANVLDGSAGGDTMAGGYGNDTYYVDSAGDLVIEANNTIALVLPGGDGAGHAGTPGIIDTVVAAINFSLASVNFVENVVLTGAGSSATGNALANELTGNAGDDTLDGGSGNDTLDGAAGNDSMSGGLGNDVYVVDAAGDRVLDTGGTETVRSSVSWTLSGGFEKLLLIGAGAVGGVGNAAANTITGNAKSNVLDGRGGADVLSGGGGNDALVGTMTDRFNGGAGTDTLRLGAGNLNLKNLDKTDIVSIEKVDLKGDGHNALTLTRLDLLDMSSTDKLTVLGDAADRVVANGFTRIANAGGFHQYKSGAAILQVEADVTVVT